MRLAVVWLSSFMIAFGAVSSNAAQKAPEEQATLDEALSGFGEESKEELTPDTQDALDGFDDDTPALPQDTQDALAGFDDETAPSESEAANKSGKRLPEWMELFGVISVSSSYNYAHEAPDPGKTDYRGVSRMRGWLDLKLDMDLTKGWKGRIGGSGFYDMAYSISGRENYTSQVLEEYENEARLKEAYVTGALAKSVDIKLGRQIVIWGRSDNIRITDVLNPMDIREPGMVDIEDIREPLAMTRLDFYTGPWSLTAVAVHEIKFNFMPPFGSEFFPLDSPLPEEDIPPSVGENTEYGLALTGVFSGFDISFYLADYFDDNFTLKPKGKPKMPFSPSDFTLEHSRLKMAGLAMNKALGNYLVKLEAAWLDGLMYPLTGGKTFTRGDGLLGLEYSGFYETMISLELSGRSLLTYEEAIGQGPFGVDRTEWQWAFRYTQDFSHQTIHLLALVSVMGLEGEGGAFERVQVKYDVMDSLSATFGVLMFQSGDEPFFVRAGDNDKAFLEIRYSF